MRIHTPKACPKGDSLKGTLASLGRREADKVRGAPVAPVKRRDRPCAAKVRVYKPNHTVRDEGSGPHKKSRGDQCVNAANTGAGQAILVKKRRKVEVCSYGQKASK